MRCAVLCLRSRWNSSRNDLATFLRLRQPALASEDVLTLVSAAHGRVAPDEDEALVVAHALDAHISLYAQLIRWRRTHAPTPAAAAGGRP